MYWVAMVIDNGLPHILAIEFKKTAAEAISLGVDWAIERDAPHDRAQIHNELEEDGQYAPEKTGQWAVNFGEAS